MKKQVLKVAAVIGVGMLALTGCTQADRVTHNISQEADNFNVDRRLVVMNTMTDKPILEVVGKFSITVDETGDKLDVIVKEDDGTYKKHFVGLGAATVVYTIEDLSGADVSQYRYQISYLPEAIIPIEIKDGSDEAETDADEEIPAEEGSTE